MTALHRCSKSDTVFLCDPQAGGAALLATDVSQERTPLTNNTTYVSEANSSRVALATRREVVIVVDMTNASSGVLAQLGNAGTYSWRVRVNAGSIEVAENGTLRVTVTIPGMVAGPRKVLIAWNVRPEDTIYRSEVLLYNYATSTYAWGNGTHSVGTMSGTDTFTIGSATAGASTFSGGVGAFYSVRISRGFHSTLSEVEDWVSQTTPPPGMTARRRTPLPTFATTDISIAGEGELAGPTYLWGQAATRQAAMRLVTPLVNVVMPSAATITNAYSPTRYVRDAPDNAVYHWDVRFLFHAYVSPKTNKARVRIFTRCVHAAAGPSIATCYFSAYSIANLPLTGQQQAPPMTYYKTAAATVASPQAAPGAWLDLGVVHVARDAAGLSYFVIGYSIGLDAGGVLEPSTQFQIKAVTIEPFTAESEGQGVDADVGLGG